MESIVISVALAIVSAGALAVVLTRDPRHQTIVMSVWGLSHVVLFVLLQAPDVALAALVVDGFALPTITLLALAKVAEWAREHELREQAEQAQQQHR